MLTCRLKVMMVELDIRQTELAAAVGKSRSAINQVANGKHEPELETAIRIAQFIGKPVEEIWQYKKDLL